MNPPKNHFPQGSATTEIRVCPLVRSSECVGCVGAARRATTGVRHCFPGRASEGLPPRGAGCPRGVPSRGPGTRDPEAGGGHTEAGVSTPAAATCKGLNHQVWVGGVGGYSGFRLPLL